MGTRRPLWADDTTGQTAPAVEARARRLADGAITKLVPQVDGLASATAIDGGGVTVHGYKFPTYGMGGSTKTKNAASPTLVDLKRLGVDAVMNMPGLGFATLDNAITTPFTTDLAGNVGNVAQPIFVEFELIPNEYDPVTSQSAAYLYQLNNAHWCQFEEGGYPQIRFRDANGVLYTGHNRADPLVANGASQWTPKEHLVGYYRLHPSNPEAGNVWTSDFYIRRDDGTYAQWGEQYVGTKAIAKWKEVLTDQAGNPVASQTATIMQGATGQAFRGIFIHLAVHIGALDAAPVLELHADQWALAGGATYTEGGRTFTLRNPQPDNFITQSGLVSAGGTAEYVILTGSADAPLSPTVKVADTRGFYPTLTTPAAPGFEWDASVPQARALYRDSNAIVNTSGGAEVSDGDITADRDGIRINRDKAFVKDKQLATQQYADASAATAQSGAVSIAADDATRKTDAVLAVAANAIAFNPNEAVGPTLAVGDERVFYNLKWRLEEDNHGLPPMGIGDGSPLDQAIALSQASPIFLANGGTGGYGAEPIFLSSLADSATAPAAGTLRKIINDKNAEFKAWGAAKWADPEYAAPEPKLYVVGTLDDLGAFLNDDDEAVIHGDWSSSDKNVRDIKILFRNFTFDFTAIPGGVVFDGGGLPGPIPYQTNSGAAAAGTYTAGSPLAVPTTSAADWGKTKMTKGVTVDIAKYADPVARTGWTIYGKSLVVEDFVLTDPTNKSGPGTLYLSGTVDTSAPSGALVIYAYNPPSNDPVTGVRRHLEPGKPGCQFVIGGEAYEDMFGPFGQPNMPAGNGMMRNFRIRSNWGGDVLDTGDLNDFTVTNWADTLSFDGCSWSNPDPFHDTMWQTARGARWIGTRFCWFGPHYKAVNSFGGNAGSGGISPDGTTPTPNVHVYPPGWDDSNAAVKYPTEPGVLDSHGNPTGLPVVVMTTLHEYAWFDGEGQRAPKTVRNGYVHLSKFITSGYGLPAGDPVLSVSTRFPLDPDEATAGPAPIICNDAAKLLITDGSLYPADGATNPKGVKNAATGKSDPGWTRTVNLTHHAAANTGVFAESEPDRRPDLVPEPPYAYTRETEDVYEPKIRNGSGAGTRSRMWSLVGPASVAATVVAQRDGVNLGPVSGGSPTEAATNKINLTGTAVADADYDELTRTTTYTINSGVNDAMVFKGVINASTNPNYPAADAGDTYKVSVAGKIGGASGPNVEVGDLLLCTVDSSATGTHAAVGANWDIQQVNIDGAVTGPASSTSGDLARFNGTTGKVIEDSGLSLDTDGTMAANSDSKLPSQKSVRTYIGAIITALGLGTAASKNVGTGPTNVAAGDVPVVRDFSFPAGNAAVTTGLYRVPIHENCTVAGVRITSSSAPTGSTIIGDVLYNGTSIYATTPANRPTIATGATGGAGGTPDTTALSGGVGNYLTVSLVQVGSTQPGANVVISVLTKRA